MTIEERNRLATDNDGFVYQTARRWFGAIAGLGPQDVVQEARLETLRRVHRWDPGRGKITTFLRRVIDRRLGRIRNESQLKFLRCSANYGQAVCRIRMGLATPDDYAIGLQRRDAARRNERSAETRRRCLHRDAAMTRVSIKTIESLVLDRKDGKC